MSGQWPVRDCVAVMIISALVSILMWVGLFKLAVWIFH